MNPLIFGMLMKKAKSMHSLLYSILNKIEPSKREPHAKELFMMFKDFYKLSDEKKLVEIITNSKIKYRIFRHDFPREADLGEIDFNTNYRVSAELKEENELNLQQSPFYNEFQSLISPLMDNISEDNKLQNLNNSSKSDSIEFNKLNRESNKDSPLFENNENFQHATNNNKNQIEENAKAFEKLSEEEIKNKGKIHKETINFETQNEEENYKIKSREIYEQMLKNKEKERSNESNLYLDVRNIPSYYYNNKNKNGEAATDKVSEDNSDAIETFVMRDGKLVKGKAKKKELAEYSNWSAFNPDPEDVKRHKELLDRQHYKGPYWENIKIPKPIEEKYEFEVPETPNFEEGFSEFIDPQINQSGAFKKVVR